MAHKGMILYREAKKSVPTSLFEAILKKYPSCAGLSMVIDGKLETDLLSGITVPELEATVKACDDNGMMLYYGNFPEKFAADDQQPFTVLKDDGVTHAVAFIDGSFPGFIDKEGKHSEHFWFAVNHLIPTLAELWISSEKDWDKFKSSLDLGLIKNSILAGAVLTTRIVILLKDGTIKLYQKDGDVIKTSFGWVTDMCTVKEGEFPVKAEAPPPIKNKAGFVRAAIVAPGAPAQPPTPPPAPVIEPEDDEPEVIVPLAATATAVIPNSAPTLPQFCFRKGDGTIWFRPPGDVHGNALKKLYNRIPGYLPVEPDNHWKHHRPEVQVTDKRLRAYGLESIGPLLKAGETAPAHVPSKHAQQQQAAPVKEKTPEPEQQKELPFNHVIEAGVIAKINATMKTPRILRFLDDHSNTIVSPATVAEGQKKVADYAESFGLKGIFDTVRWPEELLIEAIGKNDLKALARYATTWRFEALKRMSPEELAQLNPPTRDASKDPASGDKKVHPALARALARASSQKVAM